MKKLAVSLVVLAGLVLGFNIISDQYRHEFRDWAIALESDKAHLKLSSVQAAGESITYLSNESKGEAMVMLHGFSANKTSWLRLAQQFGDKYHMIIPDLKGHGDNAQSLDASYHLDDQVRFVHALMAELGITRFHLVGNSMGGAISSLYAATHPEQVLSVTLVSPAGVHDIPSDMDLLLKEGKNPLIPQTEDAFYKMIDFVMSEPPFIPAAIAHAEAENSVARYEINSKIFADLRADLERNLEVQLAKVVAPTLFIWGDKDRAINVENIEKYSQLIKGSKKAVIEDIGHVAMIEVPEYTSELMLDFLSGI